MECGRFEELLPRYLSEDLPEDERREWRGHLLECAGCRVRALEREPVLLFVLASRADRPEEKIRACTEQVVASIRRERLEGRIRARRRPWLAAAAAAVIAVGGGLAFHEMDHRQAAAPQAAAVVQHQRRAPEVDVENEGENVRVYQLATDENTTVTFVVDPAMEL